MTLYRQLIFTEMVLFLVSVFMHFFCSGSFATLRFLRFLVIDEADKLLAQHFNQWLPKLLKAVSHDKTTIERFRSHDKTTPKGCGLGKLEETLQGLCVHPQRYLLMKSKNQRQKDSDKVSGLQ